MNDQLKILGIGGSLRKGSYNCGAIRAARDVTPQGWHLDIADIGDMPLFNQDLEQSPPSSVAQLKRAIRDSDAILIATPEYNYSTSGVLKNAIDWASRPYGDSAWDGKPVGVMGVSVGMLGSVRAQYHLRQMFVFLNMYPLNQPELMIGGAMTKFDDAGNLTDEDTRDRIEHFLIELTEWAGKLRRAQELATV